MPATEYWLGTAIIRQKDGMEISKTGNLVLKPPILGYCDTAVKTSQK